MNSSSSIKLFSVRGIPVLMHGSVLLAIPIAWLASGSFVSGTFALLAYLILIVVHELGHASVARHLGLQVMSLRLYPIHGLCIHQQPHTPGQEVAIAWGGVAAQGVLLISAVLLAKILVLTQATPPRAIESLFFVWVPMNVLIIMTNLIPVAPLDGARAWRVIPMAWAAVRTRGARVEPKPEPSSVSSIEIARIARQRKNVN